jgi:ABC-type lipoprotein export system ATPase subunit
MFTLHSLFPIPLKERLLHRGSAIWNSTLQFNTESYISVIAPSGTGKTTFIHALYGIRKDYEGIIEYKSKNIKQLTVEELASIRRNEIAIVFQDLRLFPQLTIQENILLKMVLTNPLKQQESINKMAAYLSIEHILDKPAHICSYGEQQRAAIIRALVQPFQYLLLDEPFSHLDKENTQKAIQLITETCNQKKASLLIADLDENSYFNYTQQYRL